MENLYYKLLEEQCNPKQKIKQDILIIKCPFYLTQEDQKKLYDRFMKEKFQGLVLLPCGFEAVYVPHDCEIVMKTEGDGEHEQVQTNAN